jgi:hypothetical protein
MIGDEKDCRQRWKKGCKQEDWIVAPCLCHGVCIDSPVWL